MNKGTGMSLLLNSNQEYPCGGVLQLGVLGILEILRKILQMKFTFWKAARRCSATILKGELQQGRTFRTVAFKNTSGGLFLLEWIHYDI